MDTPGLPFGDCPVFSSSPRIHSRVGKGCSSPGLHRPSRAFVVHSTAAIPRTRKRISGFPGSPPGLLCSPVPASDGSPSRRVCHSPPDSTHSVSTLSTKRLFRKRPLPPPPGGFHSGTLLSFQPSGFCSPRMAGPVSRSIPPMPFPGPTPESFGPSGSEGLLPPGIGTSTTGVSNDREAHTLLAFPPLRLSPVRPLDRLPDPILLRAFTHR